MTLAQWLDDWTIVNELLLASLVLLPPVAAFLALRDRQLTRPRPDRPD